MREHERGLLYEHRELKRVLRPGRHRVGRLFRVVRVDTVSVRDPWIERPDLDVLVKSGALGDEATVVDLKDHQRAVVWIDGRAAAVLSPGLHALWNVFRDVRVETFDARAVRLEHEDLAVLLQAKDAAAANLTVVLGENGLADRVVKLL